MDKINHFLFNRKIEDLLKSIKNIEFFIKIIDNKPQESTKNNTKPQKITQKTNIILSYNISTVHRQNAHNKQQILIFHYWSVCHHL
jgi:hypothetical protein